MIKKESMLLSEIEKQIIIEYRKKDQSTKWAVRRVLDLAESWEKENAGKEKKTQVLNFQK